jgi:hypothetical protein
MGHNSLSPGRLNKLKKERDEHEEICLSVLSGVLGNVLPDPGSYDAITRGKTMIEVWGIASGRGSTKDAARGAFTWRRYNTKNFPRQDWLIILTVKNL